MVVAVVGEGLGLGVGLGVGDGVGVGVGEGEGVVVDDALEGISGNAPILLAGEVDFRW